MAIGSFIQSNTQEGAFTAVNSSAATMVDKEGYFVTPTGNMVTLEAASGGKYMEMVLVSGVTDDPIYLLQAGAAASKPIEVLPLSPHRSLRCVAGGTITVNELLTVHSDGTAVSAVNGSTIIGYAEEDAAAGGYVKFRPASPGMVHSTATAWYDGATTTLADDHTFVTGTTKGLKIGGAANQKVGFYGVTPVVQGTNTADIKDTLVALGLFADGTHATPLNLDGGALTTTGAASLTGGLTTAGTVAFETGTAAAAGSSAADATAISKTVTNVTASDNAKGVILPTAVAGKLMVVHNTVADKGLFLYPGASDTLNGLGATVGVVIPGKGFAVCYAIDAAVWAVMIGDQYKAAGHVNVDAVTGAGTTNADAAALPFVPGGFCLATGAANSGVILPAGTSIGYTYDVYIGQATDAMKVYPPAADTLNGNTHTTVGVSCAAWSLTRFINTNGTNWVAAEIPSAG